MTVFHPRRVLLPTTSQHQRLKLGSASFVLLTQTLLVCAVLVLATQLWHKQLRLDRLEDELAALNRHHSELLESTVSANAAAYAAATANGHHTPATAAADGTARGGQKRLSSTDLALGLSRMAAQQQHVGHRPHIKVFVGVMTGFTQMDAEPKYVYEDRRAALRATWFPDSTAELARWETEMGIVVRFVIGNSPNERAQAALDQEAAAYGDIMRLQLEEHYSQLTNKTRTFFKAVDAQYTADWVLKMDDDVYLNPHRLLAAVAQWERMDAQYVGCMKHGVVFDQPSQRWYEPAHLLSGPTYWLHAYGTMYALSGDAIRQVIVQNFEHLRLLANEDTSLGLWVLSQDIKHFEDMRLCSPVCTAASVGVLNLTCAGLCNPVHELQQLHAQPLCSQPAPKPKLPYHPSYIEHKDFEQMWV